MKLHERIDRARRIENITQETMAKRMRVSRLTVNQLCNGKRRLTPDMAVRLEYAIGQAARWWLEVQAAEDLREARRRLPWTK